MIKPIRTLILVAFIAFLVNGFLDDPSPHAENAFDSFFTLLLLAAIWFNLRQRSQGKVGQPPRQERSSTTPPTEQAQAEQSPAMPPVPPPAAKVDLPTTIGGMSVIYHQSPWSVVERGKALGKFRNTLISSWIRTSDKRLADYAGVHSLAYPEQCPCIEIPEKSELILPPGMIYTIRSS